MKNYKRNLTISIIFLILSFNISLNTAFAQQEDDVQLSKMEQSIWGFEYTNDDTQKRLSRIENNVFGSLNDKLSISQRIKKLNEALGLESVEESNKPAYEIDKTQMADEGINYPQIDTLEYQMFQTTYEKENIYKRLDRLEKKIFGSTQEGNLASRTERLKAYTQKDTIAKDPSYYTQKPYQMSEDIEKYMASQNKYENNDVYIQLSGLETTLFSKTYSQDPVGLRLNRLERKIFQRDFSSDDDYLRLQRLQAAASAQQTAKLYEANKFQKYAATGMQIGSIILMILALIL